MVAIHRRVLPALGLGLALGVPLLAGCGSGGASGSGTVGASNPGQVQIQMADAPVTGLQAVNVTFTKVEALYDGETDSRTLVNDTKADEGDTNADQDEHDDDNDTWQTLSTKTQTVNLLDYANKPASGLFDLLDVSLPSGHFKKFRFTISTVDLVMADGTHVTPTLASSQVVVKSQCFVHPRKHKVLVMDFNVAESLQSDGAGGFTFDPKLRLRPAENSGRVTGTVQFQATTPVSNFEANVQLVDAGGQMVGESEVEIEADTPQSTAQKTFVIHAVPPGTYTLKVLGDDTFQGTDATPAQVTVAAGQDMQAGMITLSK